MSKKIQYMHFRRVNGGTIDSRGGATVAYRIGKDGMIDKYAVAYCSPNDNYSREQGRNIAAGRMQFTGLSHDATSTRRVPAEFRAHMEREMSMLYGLSRPHMRRRITDHRQAGNTATAAPRNRH